MTDKNSQNHYKGTNLWVNRLLLLCAAADREILVKYCERKEINSHIITGILLIFTGLLATMGGGYLIHLIFDDPYSDSFGLLSIVIGLLWGYYFFTVDRGIVIDMKPPQSEDESEDTATNGNKEYKLLNWNNLFRKNTYKGRKLVVVRLSLAIINSIIVSKGLELYIFKEAVRYDIQKSNRDELENIKLSIDNQIDSLRKIKTVKIDKFKFQKDSLSSKKSLNEGQVIILRANKTATNTLANASNDLINKQKNINKSDNYDESTIKQNQLLDAQAKKEMAEVNANKITLNANANSNLITIETEIGNIKNNLSLLGTSFKDDTFQLNKRINYLLKNRNSIISQDSIGLEKHNFLPRKYSTMSKITEWSKDPYNAIFGWALMILLFSIEITPVLRKLLMPKGEYDKALEMRSITTQSMLKMEYGKTILQNNASLEEVQKKTEHELYLSILSSEHNLKSKEREINQQNKKDEISSEKELLTAEIKLEAEKVYQPLVGTWKETSLKFFEELNDLEIKMITQYINRKKELSKISDIDIKISGELNSGMINAMKETSKRLFSNYTELLKKNRLNIKDDTEID